MISSAAAQMCPNEYKKLDLLLDKYLLYIKYAPIYHLAEIFHNTCYDRWNIEVTLEGNLRWHSITDLCGSEVILRLLDSKKGQLIGERTLFNLPHFVDQCEVELNDELSSVTERFLSKLSCEEGAISGGSGNYSRLALKIFIYAPLAFYGFKMLCQLAKGKKVEPIDLKKTALVFVATSITHLAIDYMWPL